MERISVAEAKAKLSSVLERVLHGSDGFVIERRGRPIAAVVGIERLEGMEHLPGRGARGALALVGLWEEVPDEEIDAFIADVRRSREADTGRAVELAL